MTDPASKSLGKKPTVKIKVVAKLTDWEGATLIEGPRGKDAMGRDTGPIWGAVQNAKGERMYVYESAA